MTPTFTDQPPRRDALFFEHMGNRAVRCGGWKLVAERNAAWELYDLDADRTETNDLSDRFPDVFEQLSARYAAWADRCDVMEFDALRERIQS